MQQKRSIYWHIGAYTLILLSFFLRVYQLNNSAVTRDEAATVHYFIRRGLVVILTDNQSLNNHPLTSLLAYLTSLGNESVFTLRWHLVVIGVVTVAVVLRLAREFFGARDGLVAGLFISTSAYHVFLSQKLRGYVGVVGFTVLSFYFAYRAVQTGQKRYWLGFVVVSILDIYSHLYGVMAVAIVSLIILSLLVRRATLRRSSKDALLPALSPLVLSLVAIYLISFGLYWPMLPDMISVVGRSNEFRESDLRQIQDDTAFHRFSRPFWEAIGAFNLADASVLRLDDPTFRYSPFDEVAALTARDVGFYLSLVSFVLGLAVSWPKFRWQTFICAAWFVIPFIVQQVGGIILPGAYFRGRFLAFVYPPYLLFMARGWTGLADWLAVWLGHRSALKLLARSIGWLGVSALTLLNLAWLGAYYSAALNEHWNDIARHISQNMQLSDVIICGQRPDTDCRHDLPVRTGREVREFVALIAPENIRASRTHIEQPGRVWLVMPHLVPWQVASLREKVEPTDYWLAGNPRYDQAGWILIDSHQTLGDNLVAAVQLTTDISLNTEERYRNYISLAQIYLVRNQLTAAEEAVALASKLLPDDADSRQWFDVVSTQLQYARQATQPIESLPPTAVRVDLNFEGMVRLVAYEIDRQTISPGETLHADLYWQPLARIEQNLVSYVSLTDRGVNQIGQASGIPAAGQCPTTSWEPGQIVVDPHTIIVDAATQAPRVVRIEAGLFDPQSHESLHVIDGTGQPASPTIAEMKMIPSVWPAAKPAHPLNANFANLISLIGYDLVSGPPGIVFYWQPQAAMSEDYTVFVHLLDADGQLAGQLDGQPLQGSYPTSWWSPGELIVDQRLALSIAPGSYRLRVGWYRLSDGSRLPLADGSGDSVMLGTVNVP